MSCTLGREKFGRAAPLMAEMEVEADGRATDRQPLDQDARHEVVGRKRREGPVECEDQRAGKAGCGEQSQLRALVVAKSTWLQNSFEVEPSGPGRPPRTMRVRLR